MISVHWKKKEEEETMSVGTVVVEYTSLYLDDEFQNLQNSLALSTQGPSTF